MTKQKLSTIISILFSIGLLQAQKTVRVKENAFNGKAKFYVLKSNNSIKHGEYKITSYTPPFRNLMIGNYIENRKDGLWIEKYDRKGNPVRISGKYDKGEKIGEWNYYDSEGRLIHTFDFDDNKLLANSECNSNVKHEVLTKDSLKTIQLDCPPTRVGGLNTFTRDLMRQIMKKSPFDVSENGRTTINIDDTLSFWVNTDNSLEEIVFSGKSNNLELNKLVMKYINSNNDNWISGKLNGKNIKAKVLIPIKIRIIF